MPSSNIKRKKKPGPVNNAPNDGGGGNFTETAMDEYLARLDLYRKPIAKDGSCLFRAVSEQVYSCQAKHLQVRKGCIDFMRRNRDKFEAFLEGPFDHHLFRLQNPKEWAGQVEISALSLMYKKDFVVYQEINAEPTKVTDNNFKDKIMLCYSNGNHYDAVYDVKFQRNAAICQSLVYEILYQKVFGELDRKCNASKGPKQNPGSDVNSVMTNYYQNGLTEDDAFKEDNEDNSGWTEVVRGRSNKAKSARQNRVYDQEEPKEEPFKPNLDQKHGWQAKRSLDNELYRNVELEVWEESKNAQEQQDQSYAASIQYQPGDKCFAWLGQPDVTDKVYEAVVKYNLPVQSNIEVMIPELGNKCFVIPFENLKPTDNQQELNYRDLSGFYKKSEAGGGPPTNEGLRDDGKRGRRRNMQGRPQRSYKGDEHGEDIANRKVFQDESFPRQRSGPGQRDKFGRGRGRGRYPRGRDERQVQKEDEEAKQIAEQAKLVELQGKDPAAFPALPTQQAEEKLPSTEAAPDQTPAEFWSRLKNNQGKQPPVTPKENHVNASENKPPSVPSSPTDQQPHTAKPEEKELETKKEKPLAKEVKAPATLNSEVGSLEASNNHVSPETGKKEQNESQKQALFLEKEQLKGGKVEFSKGVHVNEVKVSAPTVSSAVEVKSISSKSNAEEAKFVDVVEPRSAWAKEGTEKKELKTQDKTPENNAKEMEQEVKKSDEPLSAKPQGVRGVIRMTNLNSKPQQSAESEEQEEAQKEDIKLLRKEDSVTKEVPNLKSALAGEGASTSSPEKKTVTFADPVKEGGEIKVLVSTAKDLAGKDGKRDVLAPSSLVSAVIKPAPTVDIAQDNLPVTLMSSNKSDKITSEDDVTNAKNSTPTPDANAKPQTATITPWDGSEGAEPATFSSPSVSQHQAVYQQPFLPVLYTHLPNMTSRPRLPQGISVESDGSDLPEDPNTLRYFFNLGFQYQLQLSQQWANQQMMYYPSMYQMPSQDHMQPHPAVSMGQQLSTAVPQMVYPHQMQAYHPAQIPQVMQDNTSFSDRNSIDRTSPNLTQQQQQQQQQQQPQQQQPIPLHQTAPFGPNQHHPTWRAARSMTGYQGKQMQMGGYNPQVPNQQTPRGPMQQGAGTSKHYKNKKYQKHRDQFLYGAQHGQNQGAPVHGAHAYQNASQTTGSASNAFYMTGSDHAAGKGSGDYYHGSQQFVNFHGNVSSSMTQAPHSAANSRGQYS